MGRIKTGNINEVAGVSSPIVIFPKGIIIDSICLLFKG